MPNSYRHNQCLPWNSGFVTCRCEVFIQYFELSTRKTHVRFGFSARNSPYIPVFPVIAAINICLPGSDQKLVLAASFYPQFLRAPGLPSSPTRRLFAHLCNDKISEERYLFMAPEAAPQSYGLVPSRLRISTFLCLLRSGI